MDSIQSNDQVQFWLVISRRVNANIALNLCIIDSELWVHRARKQGQ